MDVFSVLESQAFYFMLIAGFGAFMMAFANGANDVANSFASAVGAKAISIKQAVVIAGFMNLLGSVTLGGTVAATIITKIIDPTYFQSIPYHYIAAMYAVLAAAASFVIFSTLTGIPVSSTHSIIGSLTGVFIVTVGADHLNYKILTTMAISWVASPILAGIIAFGLAFIVKRGILGLHSDMTTIDKGVMHRIRTWAPYVLGLTVAVLLFSIFHKGDRLEALGLDGHNQWQLFLMLAFVLPYVVLITQNMLRDWTSQLPDNEEGGELVFRRLQVGTSCYVAFAHGANDVANAIAPVFALWLLFYGSPTVGIADEAVMKSATVPYWILILGGVGIATGVGTLGHKVIKTLGERITTLDNASGFGADLGTATTVVIASTMGIPVSSTHAATGSIVGVGANKEGWKAVKFGLLGKIFATWVATLPIAAGVAIGIYYAFVQLFTAIGLPIDPDPSAAIQAVQSAKDAAAGS